MAVSEPGEYVEVTATRGPVLIWSGEHRAWWGPHRSGYFTDKQSAGRYSLQEAILATRHDGPERQIRIEDASELIDNRMKDCGNGSHVGWWTEDLLDRRSLLIEIKPETILISC